MATTEKKHKKEKAHRLQGNLCLFPISRKGITSFSFISLALPFTSVPCIYILTPKD
jgi:hypothetical protein